MVTHDDIPSGEATDEKDHTTSSRQRDTSGRSLLPVSFHNMKLEEEWDPFDQVLLKCYDIARDTVGFLSRNGYNYLRQLKSVPLSDLDDVLTNPPLKPHQIQQVMNLIADFKDPGPFSPHTYDIAMTEPHLKALNQNLDKLKCMIEIENLLNMLHAYGVLQERDLGNINSFKSDSEKVERLCEILPKKPDIHFLFFLQALREIGQGYISAMLEETLCNEPIDGR